MKHYFCKKCPQNEKFSYLSVVILLGGCLLLIGQSVEAVNNTSLKGEAKTEFLQGGISENELIDNLERLGIKCTIHQGIGASGLDTLSVEKVRLGSSAFYGDILAGDTIKDFRRLNTNTFCLTIERAGKIYQTNLNAMTDGLTDQIEEHRANSHMLAGVEYARNLLYGHNTMLTTGIESDELSKQIASIEALKSATLLHGQETNNLLQANASMFGLSSNILRFPAHIETLNPFKASFLNINLCMAPPTDPYGKLQWSALVAERSKTSSLASAWDIWERNLGDYICRDWAATSCSSQGVVVYHVILKNEGKLGEIKLMPVAELSSYAGDSVLARCGYELIEKLNGNAYLFFPKLTQVKEVHLEIGLINKAR